MIHRNLQLAAILDVAGVTRVMDALRKLPGVGNKSAQRLAFHILRSPNTDAELLANAIRELKAQLRLCSI